jgi:hypothetical protein
VRIGGGVLVYGVHGVSCYSSHEGNTAAGS